MDLVPEDEKKSQHDSSNDGPEDEKGHHRNETKAYALLAAWIFADVLVIFGHVYISIWIFYFAIAIALGLLTHHAIKGWPSKRKAISWLYMVAFFLLPFILFFVARPSKISRTETAGTQPIVATNTTEWQPPELPKGCSNVWVFFGSQGFGYSTWIAGISTGNEGTKFEVKDLPEIFLTNADKAPNYSPRKRNMWLKWQMAYNIGDQTVNYLIMPFVISNRLYVEVEVPFMNEKRKLLMSDTFDTELTRLPNMWDRNYNTAVNAYEVVNESTNPVLQVFYTSPNEVHVNGIFVVNTNAMLVSFGGPPQLFFINHTVGDFDALQKPTNTPLVFYQVMHLCTNDSVDALLTNAFYLPTFPGQKTLFKYPSNGNPGALADWVQVHSNSTTDTKK